MAVELGAPQGSPLADAERHAQARLSVIAAGILVLLLLVTFVATPFTGDIAVFFAAAAQADYHGPFPENVYYAWELKPIGNRMLYYGVYELYSHLVAFRNKPLFEPAVKLGFAFAALLVTFVSVAGIRRVLASQGAGLPAAMIFVVFAAMLLSASYNASLQVEWISTLVVVAAIPLAASERTRLNWIAGFMLALLFPLKGISVLMAGYVFIILYAMGKPYRGRLARVVAATGIGVAVIAAGIATFFPDEIANLLFATQIQRSFEVGALLEGSKRMAIYGFLRDTMHLPELLVRVSVATTGEVLDRTRALLAGLFLNAIPNIPTLAAGALSLAMLTMLAAWRRTLALVMPSLAMWALGLTIVAVQAKFFPYHYFVLAFPAAWSFLEFFGQEDAIFAAAHAGRGIKVALVLAFVLTAGVIGYTLRSGGAIVASLWAMCVLILVVLFLSPYGTAERTTRIAGGGAAVLSLMVWIFFVSPLSEHFWIWREFRAKEFGLFSGLDNRYSLSSQESLVFLDDGRAAYYLPARSYERYFYDVPITRGHSDTEIRESPIYQGILSRLLAYRGTYILVWADDLNLDSFKEIRSKIESEYALVETQEWTQKHNYPLGNPWTRRQILALYRRSSP